MEIDNIRQLLNVAKNYNNITRFDPLEEGNIFSILNVENKEVTAHSAFLNFIFRPFINKEGKVDDLNLRLLIQRLQRKINMNTNVLEYEFVNLQREVVVEEGRLDFLITADLYEFVIELKIWAGEQNDQIKRYRNYLERNMQDMSHIFFLTPTERVANTGIATNITLKEDIYEVLCEILKMRKNKKKYCFIIEQYLALIRNLTNKKEKTMENKLFENREQILAVDTLVSERKNFLTQFLITFFDILKKTKKIKYEGYPTATLIDNYQYGETAINNYYIKGNWWPSIIYKIDNYKLKNNMNLKKGFDLYFYVEIGARIYCGFTTRIETKYEMKAVRCDAAIENYSRPKKKNSKFFPRYEFITLNGHALDFTIGRLDTQESFINELLDRDCLYKDDKINIIDSKMKEIILSIDKRYMEMCKDLFEL